jgi:predicted transposase YdaD
MSEWKLEDALVVERMEGREEGWEEGREETIKNLLTYGIPPEQIAGALKLPIETLREYMSHWTPAKPSDIHHPL